MFVGREMINIIKVYRDVPCLIVLVPEQGLTDSVPSNYQIIQNQVSQE